MTNIIETKQITKTYRTDGYAVHALRGIDLVVGSGEFLAVMGASGSGKSTLMNLLGCLDEPTSGEYYLDGTKTNKLSKNEYANIRNQKIGFVFQMFNLLPRTTALENVELPLLYDRTGHIKDPTERAKWALEKVGLLDRMHHEPNQLSGGEQQRVALARALVNKPSILLADEPTGNLDSRTSIEVMSILQELNKQGITIVMVTHEHDIARYAKRVVELHDGEVKDDFIIENRQNAVDDLARLPAKYKNNPFRQ